MNYIRANASISDCGRFRFVLTRVWNGVLSDLVFVMLNPSTADGDTDDPTIRRCVSFAKTFGYGGVIVVNLYALRSSDPSDVLDAMKVHGALEDFTQNAAHVSQECARRDVVCAWGAHDFARHRANKMLDLLRQCEARTFCLGITRDGWPRHPLYVKGDTKLIAFGRSA